MFFTYMLPSKHLGVKNSPIACVICYMKHLWSYNCDYDDDSRLLLSLLLCLKTFTLMSTKEVSSERAHVCTCTLQ